MGDSSVSKIPNYEQFGFFDFTVPFHFVPGLYMVPPWVNPGLGKPPGSRRGSLYRISSMTAQLQRRGRGTVAGGAGWPPVDRRLIAAMCPPLQTDRNIRRE